MLQIDGLSVGFEGRQVLDEVSLTLGAGQSIAVVGASGAGKSTLLRCILGAQRPDSGSILVAGEQIVGLRERPLRALRSTHLGMVFQDGELIGELDAVDNVALPLLMQGRSVHEAVARAHDLLDRFGVPMTGLPADRLSGGERQRTALARALVTKPSLVLADEPTGALDAATRDDVADTIVEWCARFGCSLVLVTHDPAVARRADQVAVLEGGVLHGAGVAA